MTWSCPLSPCKGGCSVGGASYSPWVEQVALRSCLVAISRLARLTLLLTDLPLTGQLGAWPSTPIRGAGPIEPYLASVDSSRTRSLGTPEEHTCYTAAFLFCLSWEELSLEVPVPLTSASWWCAARPTYNLSGLLLLGADWSDCEATVSRCHQLHLIPSSLSQLPRVCHRIDWHHSIGTLVHTGLSGCIMSTELANDQSLFSSEPCVES